MLYKHTVFCYTYDNLDRVIKRTTKDLNGTVLSEESYSYDGASNLTSANSTGFVYDTNNRLTLYGNPVSNIDPFGLSADSGKGAQTGNALTVEQKKKFLAIIDQIVSVSRKYSLFEFHQGLEYGGIRFYTEFTSTLGHGSLEISNIMDDHYALIQSLNVRKANFGTFERTFSSDASFGAKYSVQVDDLTSVAISATINMLDASFSAEYEVSTILAEGSVSSTLGAEFQPGEPLPDEDRSSGLEFLGDILVVYCAYTAYQAKILEYIEYFGDELVHAFESFLGKTGGGPIPLPLPVFIPVM